MNATAINTIIQSWVNEVTTYIQWPTGVIIASFIWITLFIAIIWMIFAVIRAVKGT